MKEELFERNFNPQSFKSILLQLKPTQWSNIIYDYFDYSKNKVILVPEGRRVINNWLKAAIMHRERLNQPTAYDLFSRLLDKLRSYSMEYTDSYDINQWLVKELTVYEASKVTSMIAYLKIENEGYFERTRDLNIVKT